MKREEAIRELKMKLYKWRKRHIENKYFKAFPERKGMATMEIVKSNVMPQTYYRKTVIDPWMDKDMIDEAIPHIKKNMARQLGEDLLEQGMIDIRAETFPDPIYVGKTLVAIIRVIPPMQETRPPEKWKKAHYIKGKNGEWYCSSCKRIDDKYSVARFCWWCGAEICEREGKRNDR